MTASIIQPTDSNIEIKNAIRAFVLEKFPACQQQGLEDDDSLIDSGIVDSMGILELVAFAESEFGIVVEDTDLTPENFESVAALANFVVGKRS